MRNSSLLLLLSAVSANLYRPLGKNRCQKYQGVCQDSSHCDPKITNNRTFSQGGYCDGTSQYCCLSKDYKCENARGNCISTSDSCSFDLVSVQGYCAEDDMKCCTAHIKRKCPLVKIDDNPNLNGYYHDIRVEEGFVSAMDKIIQAARDADVVVHITQAFRIDGVVVQNPVVPPARFSNHLIGHAIDFNLWNSVEGWCDGTCLLNSWQNQGKNNSHASAYKFLSDVQYKYQLNYGGDWQTPDAVHIDDDFKYLDGVNSNYDNYESLYINLQEN